MITLRRLTRPSDTRMGLVYGEDPRPVVHTSGEHAGSTLVVVTHPEAVARLQNDGWELVPSLHLPTYCAVSPDACPSVPEPPDTNRQRKSAPKPTSPPKDNR